MEIRSRIGRVRNVRLCAFRSAGEGGASIEPRFFPACTGRPEIYEVNEIFYAGLVDECAGTSEPEDTGSRLSIDRFLSIIYSGYAF